MRVTRRSYTFQIQPAPTYRMSYDWSSGSPIGTRTPNPPGPARIVEATGDDVDAARHMAASQYGVSLDAVSPIIGDDGRPKVREYEETLTETRSLRQRGRDGEDGFGR